jgi:hypothetical protein
MTNRTQILALVTTAWLASLSLGCKTASNPALGPATVRLGVSSTASYALLEYPQAGPAISASAAVICSQAQGTNLAPSAIVSAVNNYVRLTPESALIVNSAINFYTLIWQSYGETAVKNSPRLRTYLQATCDGLNDALAYVTNTNMVKSGTKPVAWPLVHSD